MNIRMTGLTAMLAAAGMARACPPGECSEEVIIEAPGGALTWTGTFETALGDPSAGQAHGFAFSTDDEDSVQISVYNNEIKVVRNGQAVPPERIQRDGDMVRILDENGEAVSEIQLAFTPDAGQWEKAVTVFGQQVEDHPPVMLGITMGEPDEALRAHLGLGERQVIMLDNVMDGLPASEAGLKRFDIIVAIEGSDDNVNPEKLLEVLKGKQPGDELKIRVLRGGEKETYTVKLRPYDEAALNTGMPNSETGAFIDLMPRITTSQSTPTAPAMPALPAIPGVPVAPSAPATPSIDVEGILNSLRQQGLSDQQIDMVKKTLRHNIEQSKRLEIMRGPQGNMIIQGPDGQTRMIVVPDAESVGSARYMRDLAGAGQNSALEERLSAMEQRLEEMSGKMDERLERVLKRVEQLTEQLERRIRDDG